MKTLFEKYRVQVVLGIILLLNVIIRLSSLSSFSIDMDEPFSVFHAQLDVPDIARILMEGNNPPLFEIILHYWIKLFGISAGSVRFPSFLFNMGTITFTFLIAKEVFNFRVGVFSTLLLSFSSYYILFSQEARTYALLVFLVAVSFYLLIRLFSNKFGWKEGIALVLTYVAIAFSHYFGVFMIGVQAGFVILLKLRDFKILKKYLGVIGGLVLCYSFYIPKIIERFYMSVEYGTWVQPVSNLGNLHMLIFDFSNNFKWIYLGVIILMYLVVWRFFLKSGVHWIVKLVLTFAIIPLLYMTSYSIFFKTSFMWKITSESYFINSFIAATIILFIVGVIYSYKKYIKELLIASWFFVPLIFFYTISFFIPVFYNKYLIFILPAFFIMLSVALDKVFKKWLFYLPAALMLGMMIYTFSWNAHYHNDMRGMMKYVRSIKTPDTRIVVCPKHCEYIVGYHYDKEVFQQYDDYDNALRASGVACVYEKSGMGLTSKTDKVIYLDFGADYMYPGNGIRDSLSVDFNLAKESTFKQAIKVYEYEKKAS